jgi:hypothetical protein
LSFQSLFKQKIKHQIESSFVPKLKLVLSGFRGLHRWDNEWLAGTCLFYEWFVTVLWVVFGSEQSPWQASFAKQSLPLAQFWKKIFCRSKLRLLIHREQHPFSASGPHTSKNRPKPQNPNKEGKKIIRALCNVHFMF